MRNNEISCFYCGFVLLYETLKALGGVVMNGVSVEFQHKKEEVHVKKSDILYRFIKRTFDILVSGLSILFLSPIFLIIIVLIRLDSKGPAIFKQKRIGKNGQAIYIYKFRSMIINAEEELERLMKENEAIRKEYLTNKKLENDPRITKIGNILRKTSLDELPQFINIFIGDMSFVGPRPYLYREIEDMKPHYENIIKMTPGLTGLWQVSGRSDIGFKERCELDTKYYQTRGLKTDIKIIFKTFEVVLLEKGAK